MCAVRYRTGEPYVFNGRRVVFTSWYFVRQGAAGWKDVTGRKVSLASDHEAGDPNLFRDCPTRGVRLAARKPVRSGPAFTAERPWEEGGAAIHTIFQEGSTYKAWGSGSWGDLKRGDPHGCYFESRDGLHWDRPNCGLIEYDGNRDNNLVGDCTSTVFLDPSAPPAERYKAISCGYCSAAQYEAFALKHPESVDPRAWRRDIDLRTTNLAGAPPPEPGRTGLCFAVWGRVSPDGLRWETLPEPLLLTHSDTQVVAYYDSFLKKYVAYFRDWMVGPMEEGAPDPNGVRWAWSARRAISRAESPDFRLFPLPELIVEPGPELGPNSVLYTNCRTCIPGAPEQHLLFPTVWSIADDTTSVKLMTGYDGRLWHDVPNGTVLETAPFGEWDGGCVFAFPNLFELPNGDFALPYTGYSVPHKYPRLKASRNCGYAVWPKGRLAGIDAPDQGQFSTVALVPAGMRARINAVTARAGSIRVEAANIQGETIPGRDVDSAVPIFGDHPRALVAWKGNDTLGLDRGQPVILRFRMDRASIFSVEFE